MTEPTREQVLKWLGKSANANELPDEAFAEMNALANSLEDEGRPA